MLCPVPVPSFLAPRSAASVARNLLRCVPPRRPRSMRSCACGVRGGGAVGYIARPCRSVHPGSGVGAGAIFHLNKFHHAPPPDPLRLAARGVIDVRVVELRSVPPRRSRMLTSCACGDRGGMHWQKDARAEKWLVSGVQFRLQKTLKFGQVGSLELWVWFERQCVL